MNNELGYKDLSDKSKEEILSLFNTNEEGLSKDEVDKRLEEYGDNMEASR